MTGALTLEVVRRVHVAEALIYRRSALAAEGMAMAGF